MNRENTAALMSMPEIATLAGVKRPVVSTWRRRYPDFPTPVPETQGRVLFSGAEVVAWLMSTGLGNADPEQLRAELALHTVATHAREIGARRLVELLGSLLCLRHLYERPLIGHDDALIADDAEAEAACAELLRRAKRMDAEDELVLREVRAAGAEILRLARLAEDLVEAAYSENGAHEWLLDARGRFGLTELTAPAVTAELRHLLATLADVPSRLDSTDECVVADPWGGCGDLITTLATTADEPSQLQVLAAERNEWRARLTRRRLLLAGVPDYAFDVQVGTKLERGMAAPDVVVTQIPYQPGEKRSVAMALKEVGRISRMLNPGSTALVLGPAAALVDPLPDLDDAKLRAELLGSGMVESVVSLPGGVLPFRPGYRCALWTLTREPVPAARGYVLLADLSAEPLDERACARLGEDVLLWRAEGRHMGAHDPRYGCIESVRRLYEALGGPLTPPRPPASQMLARTVDERPALISEAESRAERADQRAQRYQRIHGPLRGGVVRRTANWPAMTTVGAMLETGRLAKLKGFRIDPGDVGREGHHDVLGPEEVLGVSQPGGRRIDRLMLAAKYDRVALTQPGDVVYTTVPERGFMVDHNGYSVVSFPARILRITRAKGSTDTALSPRVLAALLAVARNTARSPSAVRALRRIEDYVLPDLSATDIERLDALLADIERRRLLLREEAASLDEACRLAVVGLADGTLTIDQDLTAISKMNEMKEMRDETDASPQASE